MAPVGVTLRPITKQDATTIAQLHIRSWRSAYRGILTDLYLDGAIEDERLATWRSRLDGSDSAGFGFVAEQGHEHPVGFVYAYPDADSEWGTLIDNLHVMAEARGSGIGRRLMAAVAQQLPDVASHTRMHLWVFSANTAAIRFYERVHGAPVEQVHRDAPDGGTYAEWRYGWTDPTVLLTDDRGR
jgi:ribosomal protein S18 acetylase RimI-like enzyme